MENFKEWRNEKASELKSIEDKEERKKRLEEIKSEDEYEQSVKYKEFISIVNKGDLEDIIDFLKNNNLEATSEILNLVEDRIVKELSSENGNGSLGFILKIPKEIYIDVEDQIFNDIIPSGGYKKLPIITLKEEFDIQTTPEIKRIIENIFFNSTSNEAVLYASNVAKEFKIDITPEIQEFAEARIIKELPFRNFFFVAGLSAFFKFSDNLIEIINSEILKLISDGDITGAVQLEKVYKEQKNNTQSTPEVLKAVEHKITEILSKYSSDRMIDLLNLKIEFNIEISIDTRRDICWRIEQLLYYNLDIELAREIMVAFDISDSDINADNVIIKLMYGNGLNDPRKFDAATIILKEFDVKKSNIFNSFKRKKKKVLDDIFKQQSQLKDKVLSLDSEAFLYFITLEPGELQEFLDKPQLLDSFLENPSMATKLLIKYPEFHDDAKENIDIIFEIKKKIIDQDKDIDPNSLEFRKLIQKELLKYKENERIVNEMQNAGVNTETWLNYEEETEFELGGIEKSFAELVKPPTDRIKIILDKFNNVTSEVLSQYKKELLESEVSVINEDEIKEKINQMNSLIQQAINDGNEKKAGGIKKGVENLEKQLENSKKIPVWIKVMGEVDLVKKMFDKTLKINEKVIELNKENEKLSLEQGSDNQKVIFKNKKKMNKLVEEFSGSLNSLSARINDYFINTKDIVSSTLGEDRTDSLIQEMKSDLNEHIEHFNSDKNTLENILNEDEYNDKVGSLLKIKVWDRNPDIDLYMGNYTDCCIRIDSDYHGSDSPISDYLTDLGVQIVAMYDSETNKPFAAAWCYLGVDDDNNKAFVVDNIEAYGPNMRYGDKITEEFKKYIENFSNKVGVDFQKISQGPYNNDIEITQNLEERYRKLGGYNNPDGYYLEAEPDKDSEYDDFEWDENEEVNEDQEAMDYYREQVDNYSDLQQDLNSISDAFERSNNK